MYETLEVFWDLLILPVLERLRPKEIIEIGCLEGSLTKHFAEYCLRQRATLHCIDPEPAFETDRWQQRYGKAFCFHRDLSLNALPSIVPGDFVVIDGDHNWCTVFHELQLIEKGCQRLGAAFPIILLHDTGWPYGRRDAYYNPQTIPEKYRQPCEQKGVKPGAPSLQENGGMNADIWNAVSEETPRNGVRTAIEDFLSQSEYRLEFQMVPGFYGVGLIVPTKLRKQNREVNEFLNLWSLSEPVRRYLERLEAARIHFKYELTEHRWRISQAMQAQLEAESKAA